MDPDYMRTLDSLSAINTFFKHHTLQTTLILLLAAGAGLYTILHYTYLCLSACANKVASLSTTTLPPAAVTAFFNLGFKWTLLLSIALAVYLTRQQYVSVLAEIRTSTLALHTSLDELRLRTKEELEDLLLRHTLLAERFDTIEEHDRDDIVNLKVQVQELLTKRERDEMLVGRLKRLKSFDNLRMLVSEGKGKRVAVEGVEGVAKCLCDLREGLVRALEKGVEG